MRSIGHTGQANESGQGYEKWTAKKDDIYKQTASVLRLYGTVAEIANCLVFRKTYSGHFCD